MNKVFLIGNLTHDPEFSQTAAGVKVCKFSLAVARRKTSAESEPQTDFFNVSAWRALGENVARYCRKGKKVAVVGQVTLRDYTSRDGARKTSVEIIADDVEFLSQKGDDDVKQAPARKQSVQLQETDEFDDLPF